MMSCEKFGGYIFTLPVCLYFLQLSQHGVVHFHTSVKIKKKEQTFDYWYGSDFGYH